MAYYTQHKTYGLSERVLASIGKLFHDAAARHAHQRVYRATLTELRNLSDRDLADLGLNQSTLQSVAKEAADMKVAL